MTIEGCVRTTLAIAAGFAWGLLIACCGGNKQPAPGAPEMSAGHPGPVERTEIRSEEVLAKLDVLATPEGVDSEVFDTLICELRQQLVHRDRIVSTPSVYAVSDLAEVTPATEPPAITWSSEYFIADGSLDGVVGISDITPVAIWYGTSVLEEPQATVADYERDEVVNIADITPLAITYGQDTAGFSVRIATSPEGSFSEVATVPWDEQLEERNVQGFAVFERQFSPDEYAGMSDLWALVVPYDDDGVPGESCEPVQLTLPTNQPPVADLTASPTEGAPPLEVNFDATGSSDDQGIMQYDYDWEGDGTYDLTDGGPAPSHIYDNSGEYSATVRVSDVEAEFDTDTVVIVVNQPPVAVIAADPDMGLAPLLVNFDASESYDPDNDVPPNRGIQLFEWDFESDGTYDESGASSGTEHTYEEPSLMGYMATLRVTDAQGAVDTDSVSVQVYPAGEAPFIDAVSPLAGEEDAEVTLTATVSGTQPFDYFFEFTQPVSWATPDFVEDSGDTVQATVTLGSPGDYTLIVNVSNDSGVHEKDFAFTIYEAGAEWAIYPVDESKSAAYSSLALVAEKPTIAYFDDGADDLFYAYSENSDGSASWAITTVDAKGMGMGDVGMYCSLADIGGKPAISYYEGGIDFNLKFATNPNADGSGSWTTGRVDTGGDAGWITSVAEVDGRPAIGYFSDDATLDYRFAINASADGSGEWMLDSVATVNSGMFADGRVLRILDGRPAVAFYNWDDGELQFAINASSDGSGEWSAGTVNATMALFVSMASVNGLPAIAYRNFDDGGLDFALNTAQDGGGTWSSYQVVASIAAQYTSVYEISGFPAIAYRNHNADTLNYAVCDAADGNGSWSVSTVDSGSGPRYLTLIEVSGRAAIAYANTGTGELMYALRNW